MFKQDVEYLLDTMIRLKKVVQASSLHFGVIDQMHPAAYLREFCTIGATLPRRSGKTSAIRSMAGRDDLVVLRNGMLDGFFNRDSVVQVNTMSFDEFLKYDQNRMSPRVRNMIGRKFKRIFVDEPPDFDRNSTDFFRNATLFDPELIIILETR